MKNLLCSLRLHEWLYESKYSPHHVAPLPAFRICTRCPKVQEYMAIGWMTCDPNHPDRK